MFDNIALAYDLLNHTLTFQMSIDRHALSGGGCSAVVGEVRLLAMARPHPGRGVDPGTGDLAIVKNGWPAASERRAGADGGFPLPERRCSPGHAARSRPEGWTGSIFVLAGG